MCPAESPCLDASVSRMTASPSDAAFRRELLRSSRVKLSVPWPSLHCWTSSERRVEDGGRTTWTVLCSGRSQPCHRRGQADSYSFITVPQGFSNIVWSVTHHAPVHSEETLMLLSGLGSVLSRLMWLLSSSKLDFMMIHFVIVLTGPLLLSNLW